MSQIEMSNLQAPVKLEKKVDVHDDVIDGLKRLYRDVMIPLEKLSSFEQFHSPPMKLTDFEASPMVMLLGQYSVGKTSFIEYLLGRSYPGQIIGLLLFFFCIFVCKCLGPEPTTDRFVAVYYGEEENVIPGNTASMQQSLPFRSLEKFGNNFLNRFNVAQCKCPFLQSITLIDTPGVLSGEHQKSGRYFL
jgi:hypothetical protein